MAYHTQLTETDGRIPRL